MKSSVSGGFPVRKSTMPRKMSDVTPLKGIPARPMGPPGFRNPRVAMPNRFVFSKTVDEVVNFSYLYFFNLLVKEKPD